MSPVSSQKAILRVLDANYNRTKEALRVLEDIARFVLNAAALSARIKKCRHQLTQALLQLPVSYKQFVLARDAANDVGKTSGIADCKKPKIQDLVKANARRGQESLRVLEEFTKIIGQQHATRFQKIRFELYELEKQYLSKF